MKLPKKNFTTLFLVVLSLGCYAQDLIVTRDGSVIQAKVAEIGTSEVKYKKWANIDGPIYVVAKSDILAITYQNGEKESFTEVKIEPKQTALVSKGPQRVDCAVASDNSEVIRQYDKNLLFSIPPKKIGKTTPYAIGVFAFSENSVLSNDDVEIEFAVSKCSSPASTPLGGNYYTKNEHLIYRYCIVVKNKTDKTLYFDLANCSRSCHKTRESYSFYTGESISVSYGNTTSAGIGIGGGILGGLGIGVGLGGASTTATAQSFTQERIVSIPPHGISIIRDFKLTKIRDSECKLVSIGEEMVFGYSLQENFVWGGNKYQEHGIPSNSIKVGEILNYSFENSPLVLDYVFTYSNSPDFSVYSTISSTLFLKEMLGYPYVNFMHHPFWLHIKCGPTIPIVDQLQGYDDKTIIGPIVMPK